MSELKRMQSLGLELKTSMKTVRKGFSRLVAALSSALKLSHAMQSALLFAEQRATVRHTAICAHLLTILRSEQREGYAFPGQFTMNPGVIRHGVGGSICVLLREEDGLEVFIGDVVIQRVGNTDCFGLGQSGGYCVSRTLD